MSKSPLWPWGPITRAKLSDRMEPFERAVEGAGISTGRWLGEDLEEHLLRLRIRMTNAEVKLLQIRRARSKFRAQAELKKKHHAELQAMLREIAVYAMLAEILSDITANKIHGY